MMRRRRLASLPLLVHAGPFLFLFLSLTLAEKRVSVPLGTSMTLESGTVSSTLTVGQIHGMGNVDLAHVILDWNSSTTGSTAIIDKSEWVTVAAVAGLTSTSHVPSHTQLMTWALDVTQRQKYLAKELGIGAYGQDQQYYGCCTRDALEQEACSDATKLGHLILGKDDHDVGENTNDRHIHDFSKLQHRNISADPATNKIWYPYGLESILWVDRTRPVVLVFANCWQEGNLNTTQIMPKLSVRIHGSVDFVSEISPRTIPLYLLLTICHACLPVWYRRLMLQHAATRIVVEDWIFTVLILAAIAVMVQTLLYTLQAFTMQGWLVYLSVVVQFLSATARAVSRCLYLVLAMGMGVITTTPTLRTVTSDWKMICIVVLLGLCLWCQMVDSLGKIRGYYSTSMTIALTLKEWLYGLLWIWIPCEICRTLRHLEYQKEEPHKVERYRYIWKIFLLAVGLTVAQYGVLYIDVTWNGARDFTFADLQEIGDCIYVILLTSIAYLWRPNPSQSTYAYQLLEEDTGELSPTNNNGHTLSLELSLQEKSAVDDDNGEYQEQEVEFSPS